MAAAASPSAPQPSAPRPAATSAPKPRSTIQAPAQPPTPTQQAPQTTSGAS
jgi:hypothetical protein